MEQSWSVSEADGQTSAYKVFLNLHMQILSILQPKKKLVAWLGSTGSGWWSVHFLEVCNKRGTADVCPEAYPI